MQSRTKLVEKKRAKKRKTIFWTLNVSCILTLLCATFQTIQLLRHCGRDFRLSHLSDPFWEQLFMVGFEIVLSIAGLIGLFTRRGAVYFVAISFWICTTMIQHIVDVLMGVIYMFTYGEGFDGVENFLVRNYKNYKSNKFFGTVKINRIHTCKMCCGVNGIYDEYVRYPNMTLIPTCCPLSTTLPCTAEKAYKTGCAMKLLDDEEEIRTFHIISAISIIFQFYNYRVFLNTFV